jgi:hypothetical protein
MIFLFRRHLLRNIMSTIARGIDLETLRMHGYTTESIYEYRLGFRDICMERPRVAVDGGSTPDRTIKKEREGRGEVPQAESRY